MKEVCLMVTCLFLIALAGQPVVAQAAENKAAVQADRWSWPYCKWIPKETINRRI